MHSVIKVISDWNIYFQDYTTLYIHSQTCQGCKVGMPV